MDKGCPILRHAYIIAKSLAKDEDKPSVKEARCMETYCEIWDEKKNQCSIKTKEQGG